MNKLLITLCFASSLASTGKCQAAIWSIDSEVGFYINVCTNSPSSVILAQILSITNETDPKRFIKITSDHIGDASKFILLQFVNTENGIYKIKLLVQKGETNAWTRYSLDRDDIASKHILTNHAEADTIFASVYNGNGGIDYSRYRVSDATAAFVTVGDAKKITHYAVYDPSKDNKGKIGGKPSYASISSLVRIIDQLN